MQAVRIIQRRGRTSTHVSARARRRVAANRRPATCDCVNSGVLHLSFDADARGLFCDGVVGIVDGMLSHRRRLSRSVLLGDAVTDVAMLSAAGRRQTWLRLWVRSASCSRASDNFEQTSMFLSGRPNASN